MQKGIFVWRVVATYSSLTTSALSELIEVNEELSDTDAVLGDVGLQALFNIELDSKLAVSALERGGMTMASSLECGHNVTEGNCLN